MAIAKHYGECSEVLVFIGERGRKTVRIVKTYSGSKIQKVSSAKCPNLGRDSISCCRKIGEYFPAVSKCAGKPFQQGVSDSHSLLEFSESTVSNRELSELFGSYRAPRRELSELLSAYYRVHAKGVVLCEAACFCLLSAF